MKKVVSMIICIVLIGITLLSLSLNYLNYKDDIVKFNNQREVEQEKQAGETEKLSEKAGYNVTNFTPDDFDLNPTRDFDSAFKTKLIIHLVIIGFIILSEIGLLFVLPRNKKSINVVIK